MVFHLYMNIDLKRYIFLNLGVKSGNDYEKQCICDKNTWYTNNALKLFLTIGFGIPYFQNIATHNFEKNILTKFLTGTRKCKEC